MVNIFKFYSLQSFLRAIHPDVKQTRIAKAADCTRQKVSFVFGGKVHWIYPKVGKWRGALKLDRHSGDYFELLAIISAYPYYNEREKMLRRLFVLAGRLENELNPTFKAANSLVYWLDPIASLLRTITDFHDFPKDEEQIPEWVADRLVLGGAFKSYIRSEIPDRVEKTWQWLKKIKAVQFDENAQRWDKTEPTILSQGKRLQELPDIQSALMLVRHFNVFSNFKDDLGTDHAICDLFSIFSMPDTHLGILETLCRDFIVKTTKYLNVLSNSEYLKEIQEFDPDYYNEVLAFKNELKKAGINITPVTRKEPHTIVQLLVAAKRASKWKD